jgi:dipeptidyl aminopeptidase/acylaminoacyl peptidase
VRRALVALAALGVAVASASADGRTPPLVSSLGGEEQVAWSPDGRWIALSHGYGTTRGLTLVRSDGRGEWLVGPSGGASLAAWAPTSSIAWTPSRPGWNLTLVRPANRSLRRIEVDAGPWYSWSPDGTSLAFLQRKSGFHPAVAPFSLMAFDVREGRKRELAPAPLNLPNWSPDGSEVAFVRQERAVYGCDRSSIRSVPAAGGAERHVVDALDVRQLRWSPRGDRLAFASLCQGAYWGIWIVGRDGTGLRKLDNRWWAGLAWSPDGTMVAGIAVDQPNRLVVREVDGPGLWEFGRYPSTFSWSPDSRRLLFSTRDVAVAEVGGGEQVLLRGNGADWSPDGRRIGFVRNAYARETRFRTCGLHLWIANADGTKPRPASRCRVRGTAKNDRIWGTVGPDDIDGFRGRDAIGAGIGDDLVGARDGEADRISCGPGQDVATVDRRDRVSGDCEVVRR